MPKDFDPLPPLGPAGATGASWVACAAYHLAVALRWGRHAGYISAYRASLLGVPSGLR